jgi:hypothetical protein
MQGRPLRCQHGRRWSQSARARWCCISWRSGGRLAVPGPKSDRAAPSWRGWVAQKSAAHHAMVPMQLHKHCHSRDLAERWRLAYCIILWPLYSLRNGQRPRMCRILVGGPTCKCEMTTDAPVLSPLLLGNSYRVDIYSERNGYQKAGSQATREINTGLCSLGAYLPCSYEVRAFLDLRCRASNVPHFKGAGHPPSWL